MDIHVVDDDGSLKQLFTAFTEDMGSSVLGITYLVLGYLLDREKN
ncbi:MAG: hypothetical protein ACI92E_001696 [Oceanicoccus sp.]|jgi:hypothetical protein